MDTPPPEPVCDCAPRNEAAMRRMQMLEREVPRLQQELAETRQTLAALHQTKVCPKSAMLVLERSTEVPLFVDVDKFVVDLSKCQELRQKLSAMNVRQVFLFVPVTTDPAHQSVWQTVINDCTPTNATIAVCPAPRQFLNKSEMNAFKKLLYGLDRQIGELRRVMPLELEAHRPQVLFGIDDNQETEENNHWRFAKKLMEEVGMQWPTMVAESHRLRRTRLQIPSGNNGLSKEERVALFEKCMRRYKRIDRRFWRVESLIDQKAYYVRCPLEKVEMHVRQFNAQRLDEFWLRMDRWEGWLRRDEFRFFVVLSLVSIVEDFAEKCMTWFLSKIRTFV